MKNKILLVSNSTRAGAVKNELERPQPGEYSRLGGRDSIAAARSTGGKGTAIGRVNEIW